MSGKKFENKSRRGFTLTEALMVVAIITILLSVSVPNIVALQRQLRQTELDDKAKIVYAAAQNQLVKLGAAGNLTVLEGIPVGAAGFKYITNDGSDAAKALMPQGILESSISGYHWIIELGVGNSSINGVFYSEESDLCTGSDYSSSYEDYRQSSGRISAGAKIGYYGNP